MAGSCNTTTPPNYLVNLRIIALHFARAGPKNSPIYAYQLEFVF